MRARAQVRGDDHVRILEQRAVGARLGGEHVDPGARHPALLQREIEGVLARWAYRSLYKMHEVALHGPIKVALDTLSRLLTRRTEPQVKLH